MKLKSTIIFLTLLLASHGYAEPYALSVNSDGPNAETSDSLYRIDLADGSVQRIGKVRPSETNINSDIEGLAFDINGILYGVDDADETLLSINTGTGLATSVTGNAFNLQLSSPENYDFGMTFTCDNSILVVSDKTETLYSAEIGSPTALVIGSENSLFLPITGIAAWGDSVFGIGQGVNDNNETLIPNLYSIDPENGTASFIGAFGDLVAPYADAGLAFDESGQLWALTDRSNFGDNGSGSELVRINTASGEAEQVLLVDIVGFESLAISSPGGCEAQVQPPVSSAAQGIPALSRTSLVLLSLILGIFGFIQIRRFN